MYSKDLTLVMYKNSLDSNYLEAKRNANAVTISENLDFLTLVAVYSASLELEYEISPNSSNFVVLCGTRFLEVKRSYKITRCDYDTFYRYFQSEAKKISLKDRIIEALNFEMFSYDDLEAEHSEIRNLLTEIIESKEI